MGFLFVLMGKSATGKDSIYKKLLEGLDLRELIPYTTRPMRKNETEGVEYHFVTEAELKKLRESGKVIEERCFHTIDGPWYYFTVDDSTMDLTSGDYICINTLAGFAGLRKYFGKERVKPIYIEVSDVELLKRAVSREEKQAKPNIAEVCRRFLADSEDFSEENLKEFEVDEEYRFLNEKLDCCTNRIIDFIKEN
ncbi:MAG: guanylate kinase [Catonella sp.]|uniref:guanylate kinase n=1 Tax=Catonella sp. TaxID=2382125 RepID=UPI003F9EE716